MPAPPSLRVSARDFYHRTMKEKFATRRMNHVMDLILKAQGNSTGKIKVLDVGCATGRDFLTFARDETQFELYGMDNRDFSEAADGWSFVQGDAGSIDFPDNEFDVVVSIGVLEHIKPIMKLDKVSEEINRVGKNFIIIVPSNGTWLEPHRIQFNWQKRAPGHKMNDSNLFYYSDEAWLQFTGFSSGTTHRFSYIPGLINNLVITNVT